MSVDIGRLGRILVVIGFVSAVFLFTTAQRFGTGGRVFPIAVVSVGSISVVTAIIGFLIAAEEMMGE